VTAAGSGTATYDPLVRRRRIVLVGGALVGSAALAAAAAVSIDRPATVSTPAERVGTSGSPTIGGCPMFPPDNAWNADVSAAPLRDDSDAIVGRIQADGGDFLHPDFGENPDYGIPFVVVPADQALVPITYTAYGDESDPGPFPVPLDAPVEGGSGSDGDRHVLVLHQGTCDLFELFRAFPSDGGWAADSGARFDLRSNALRPLGWTSADAAGLPILPGLVRYDEVAAGEIRHAIRITFSSTRDAFILPATHSASTSDDPTRPPMGLRLRMKASYDVSDLHGQALVIATAMQRYGVIVADNGSNWYFQGAPDPRWNDDDLDQLKSIPGTAFEVVDSGPLAG
jgi:hypothetical protein